MLLFQIFLSLNSILLHLKSNLKREIEGGGWLSKEARRERDRERDREGGREGVTDGGSR
jgi:hypothetical protein